MYPETQRTQRTTVSVADLSAPWEGALRPGHFDGVATVVTKLFAQAGPCRAYFGEKDFQQLAVVRRLTADLSLPVEVVGCPTVREADGLALSSRNVYLTPLQRAAAPRLHDALMRGRALALAAEPGVTPHDVEQAMVDTVATAPELTLDYAAVVDAATLVQAVELAGELRLLIAARLGRTRLIDNLGVTL
jgi:pantoate--beta-alanine ligase